MKKSNVITILFPALVMIIVSTIAFTDILNISDIDAKGLIIIGMVLIFPISFLIQGILCALTNTNMILSLGLSISAYIVIMFIFLNDLSIGYTFIYLIAWLIGYFITKFLRK